MPKATREDNFPFDAKKRKYFTLKEYIEKSPE